MRLHYADPRTRDALGRLLYVMDADGQCWKNLIELDLLTGRAAFVRTNGKGDPIPMFEQPEGLPPGRIAYEVSTATIPMPMTFVVGTEDDVQTMRQGMEPHTLFKEIYEWWAKHRDPATEEDWAAVQDTFGPEPTLGEELDFGGVSSAPGNTRSSSEQARFTCPCCNAPMAETYTEKSKSWLLKCTDENGCGFMGGRP